MADKGEITQYDWKKIKSIFGQLIELPTEQIKPRLEILCGGDEQLKTKVTKLIEVHLSSDNRTVTPQQSAASILVNQHQLKAGDVFGKYRIIKNIGTGGMGQVYLAQRSDEVIQRVAIKVLNHQLTDTQAKARFDTERRILASLEHPYIARLIDAGTESGVAYSVMEYIDGIALDLYCKTNKLVLKGRLRLFLKVCEAVKYAHSHLIVHRDLKPNNILVTPTGEIKLLDFGIAKPLKTMPGTETTNQTMAGATVLTPQYAAPEQINGQPITVACDVYVLGLLLYHLITEQNAFELSGRTWGEIERIINHELPILPSKKIKNQGSNVAAKTWQQSIKGDLDAIIIHALKKESDQRYASVNELASDIKRFLNHEPIVIKRNQRVYRLKKQLKKHWLLVSTITAIFAVLVTSSLMILNQSNTIKQERDKALTEKQIAEEVTAFLVDTFKSADPTKTMGTKITAGDILKQGVNQLERQQPGSKIKNRLLSTLAEVYLNLSEFSEAGALLDQYQYDPSTVETNQKVGLIETKLKKGLGDNLAAQQNIAELKKLVSPESDFAYDLSIVESQVLYSLGDETAAKELSRRLVDQVEIHHGLRSLRYVNALINEAGISAERGNVEATLNKLLLAQQILEESFSNQKNLLADLYNRIARLYRQLFQYELALQYTQTAYDMAVKIYGQDSLRAGQIEHSLGNAKKRLHKYFEAIEHFKNSLAVKEKFYGDNSPKLATGFYSIAAIMSGYLDQDQASIQYYESAFDLLDGETGKNLNNLQIMRVEYTCALIETGKIAKAKSLLYEMIDYFEAKQRIAGLNVSVTKSYLAYALVKEGAYKQALILLHDSIDIMRNKLSQDDIMLITAEKNLKLINQAGFF